MRPHQPAATTLAFSYVFILILCLLTSYNNSALAEAGSRAEGQQVHQAGQQLFLHPAAAIAAAAAAVYVALLLLLLYSGCFSVTSARSAVLAADTCYNVPTAPAVSTVVFLSPLLRQLLLLLKQLRLLQRICINTYSLVSSI